MISGLYHNRRSSIIKYEILQTEPAHFFINNPIEFLTY